MLSKRMLLATALVALGAGLAPFDASADAYPDRPIRLIVPYAAGGGTDAIARVIAQGMTEQLGQQLVVDNNGTADECEAAGKGSRCDVFKGKCTLPYADRKAITIPWYVNGASTSQIDNYNWQIETEKAKSTVNPGQDAVLLTITGIDKEAVGQLISKIRNVRPPEPYKGKGIKYLEEKLKRKVGKTGAS